MLRFARHAPGVVACGVILVLTGIAAPRTSCSRPEVRPQSPDLSGTWSPLSVSGVPPSRRRDFSVAYTGQSMVVFGGYDGQPLNDTYLLVLAPAPAWQRLATTGTPVPRAGHRAIYDPPRNRQVIFGGYGYTTYLGDPRELLLATTDWNFLNYGALVPSPRAYYGLVRDPLRQRALLIGGYNVNYLGYGPVDVWSLALTGPPNWTPLSPAGPTPSVVYGHSLIYQPGRDRVIMFGGFGITNAVWELSLAGTPTWQSLKPTGSPPSPRFNHVAAYDALRDRMVIYGGFDGVNSLNDVWVLSLGSTPTWSQLSPPGPLPEARSSSGGVYDVAEDRLIVFGGFNATAQRFLNDSWTLTWSFVVPAQASVVSARAEPGIARVTWQVAGGAGSRVTVHRREERGGWHSVSERFVDGESRVGYEDREVESGARYGYRLGLSDGVSESFSGEIWLDVPRAAHLSLTGVRPNPASRVIAIAFSLENESPAMIELVDTAGRQVLEREVGGMGPGEHELRLEEARSLPAGLYLVRLRQQGHSLSRKVLIMR